VVSLRPLREEEYPAWDHAHRAEYERGLVEFAGLSRDEARAKVAHDVPSVLPDGLATADTRFWMIEDDGRRVGTIFLGIRGGEAWLYDIVIDEAERGRGLGRAAMLALEDEVRALGHDSIGLNVWGGNAVARALYRSLGYAERWVHMRKAL
jgi:ribosomal protein S18 acetylase RimI-like enzyme